MNQRKGAAVVSTTTEKILQAMYGFIGLQYTPRVNSNTTDVAPDDVGWAKLLKGACAQSASSRHTCMYELCF